RPLRHHRHATGRRRRHVELLGAGGAVAQREDAAPVGEQQRPVGVEGGEVPALDGVAARRLGAHDGELAVLAVHHAAGAVGAVVGGCDFFVVVVYVVVVGVVFVGW